MDKEIKILIGVCAVVTLIGFVAINQCARLKPTAAEMAELIDSPTESREIDVPSSRELAERFNRMTKAYAEEDKRYRNSSAQFEKTIKSLEAHRKLEAQQIAEMKAKMKAIGPRQELKVLTFAERVRLSRERALRRYPDAGDGDSPFSREMGGGTV
jgi:hypothetical protein